MALNVTLRQLQFVREVARHQNISRAGEAIHVAQPTISAAIAELEKRLGVVLFEPVGRQIQLTQAGQVLNRYGEEILATLADAERALQALRLGDEGRLEVGASSTPGTYLLPPVLGAFRRSYPKVELALAIADTREVLDRVLNGRLDLGVVGESRFAPCCEVERLLTETLVLILPPDHPLAQQDPVSLRDLAGHPFVLRERGSSTRELLERALGRAGVAPGVIMELGNTEAVKKSVAAGLGVSVVSEHAISLEQKAGVLTSRRLPELHLERGIFMVWRRTLEPTPLQTRLLDALRATQPQGSLGGRAPG